MLVLFDTPAGHALFKVLDESKMKKPDDLWEAFQDVGSTRKLVKLKQFHKFDDTAEAVQSATALVEGKLSAGMKKFLKKNVVSKEVQGVLAVGDSKLGGAIKEKLNIQCVWDDSVMQLMRGLRNQMENLIDAASGAEMRSMQIGLAHSLSRYKLKFSPDKVDTMVVQAVGLLDDLDKELNTYAMRLKEWYGWHFPELGKIVPDNLMYGKVVQRMRMLPAQGARLRDILAEEVETEMKEAAEISMGTEARAAAPPAPRPPPSLARLRLRRTPSPAPAARRPLPLAPPLTPPPLHLAPQVGEEDVTTIPLLCEQVISPPSTAPSCGST